MTDLTYDNIKFEIQKIHGFSDEHIRVEVNAVILRMDNLVNDIGGILIYADNLGVKLR